MAVKELRELLRDRRTVAMLIFLPVLLIVIFGYAASFNVSSVPVTAVGQGAGPIAAHLPAPFRVVRVEHSGGRGAAVSALRDGETPAAVVVGGGRVTILLDGSQYFTTETALRALGPERTGAFAVSVRVEVLFNPSLRTSDVMVPGLAGLILLFIGTVITSLGVVRERQAGTLEQLAVMPLRPTAVFFGKITPYFAVGVLDMVVVVGAAVGLFGVPFAGSVPTFALGALLFLFAALGIGILISSVSQNQGQAIQLAIMALLPQIMLSGLIFPLSSMAAGVRWLGYVLPLTYFVEIARGVMLRAAPIGSLWQPLLVLGCIGLAVFAVASLRFARMLSPAVASSARRRRTPARGEGKTP